MKLKFLTMQLAFVTSKDESNLAEDDKALANYLSKKSIIVSPVVWNDVTINWQG